MTTSVARVYILILLLLQHMLSLLPSDAQVLEIELGHPLALRGLGVQNTGCGCMILTYTAAGVLHIPHPLSPDLRRDCCGVAFSIPVFTGIFLFICILRYTTSLLL